MLTSFLLLLSLQAVHAPGCAQAPAAGCRQQLMSQLALCYAFKQPSVACHSCMPLVFFVPLPSLPFIPRFRCLPDFAALCNDAL